MSVYIYTVYRNKKGEREREKRVQLSRLTLSILCFYKCTCAPFTSKRLLKKLTIWIVSRSVLASPKRWGPIIRESQTYSGCVIDALMTHVWILRLIDI